MDHLKRYIGVYVESGVCLVDIVSSDSNLEKLKRSTGLDT